MRISTRGRYSLKLMVDIADHGGCDRPVSLSAVARRMEVSPGYLEHLARALRHAGLLRSVVGRHGGYLLSRPAVRISVLEILEAAIGPIEVVECLAAPEGCALGGDCECRLFFALLHRRVTETMQEVRLSDLLDPGWRRIIEAHLAGGAVSAG
jgi:Rrf2 family protein